MHMRAFQRAGELPEGLVNDVLTPASERTGSQD